MSLSRVDEVGERGGNDHYKTPGPLAHEVDASSDDYSTYPVFTAEMSHDCDN